MSWEPQVGDEVRIKSTEDCHERWAATRGQQTIEGHTDQVHGKNGTVTHVDYTLVESHPYLVEFDQAITVPSGHRILGAMFAADELEPTGVLLID